MSINPVTYTIYEGQFLTLAPVVEQSINILRFMDEDNNSYNILINRAALEEEQTVDEFCEKEWEKMKLQVPGFEMEGSSIKHAIGPAKLPVVQAANKYLQDGTWIKQVMSFISLPYHPQINPSSRNLLIFTLASYGEFSEAQRKHYVRIINSFVPNEQALSI